MNNHVRRAALLAVPLLAVPTLAVPLVASASPIPIRPGTDRSALSAGAGYLAAQAGPDHLLTISYIYPEGTPPQTMIDYGLTIDAGYALDAAGGRPAELAAMTDALLAHEGDYATGGGSRAKLASFLLAQGRDTAAVDQLVAELEDHISAEPGLVGRLVDPAEDPNDYNTPLTQAYAVAALDLAASAEADEALAFLLDQQCADGSFREYFSAKDATVDQTCAGTPASTPSIDTTALAVLMLQGQQTDPAVADAIARAAAWLASQQAANGAIGVNANATGLAGWALGVAGDTGTAAKAAGWVRRHQLANVGACAPYAAADQGAITVDDLDLANARSGPLDLVDTSVTTRATAQALPVLAYAPGAAGALAVSGPTGFVRAGSTQVLTIAGVAPDATACLTGDGTPTRLTGTPGALQRTVTLPAKTAEVTYAVAGSESTAGLTVRVLAATRLKLALAKKVAKGAKQKVRVSGLAPSEKVTVRVRGTKVDTGRANAAGVFKAVFKATGKPGKRRLTAVGQFGDRAGKATFKVVR